MTPEDAVAVACDRCVTAASLLAAARLPVTADDNAIGRVLSNGVVSGWADHATVGSADATGIAVRERGAATAVRVRWTQVAAAIRPSLHEPGTAQRLATVYGRYVEASLDTSISGRLTGRTAAAELAQVRRGILARAFAGVPVQQSLFPPPPSRGRGLA